MDWTWALLDVVQDVTLLSGRVEVGAAVAVIADAVGLSVVGAVPGSGTEIDVELRAGERWLERLASGRQWGGGGGCAGGRWIFRRCRRCGAAISLRTSRSGRSATGGR